MPIQPFDRSTFLWGQAGLPGTGITSGEVGTINSRLDALEAIDPATSLAELGDVVLGTPTAGDLLYFNGDEWVNYAPPDITMPFNLPFVLDGVGSTLTTGIWYSNIDIGFACQITGWVLVASPTTNASITVSRSTYSTHPTYSDILTATLTAQTKNRNLSITPINLAADDLLRVTLDSVSAATFMTLNLRLTRTL